MNTLYQRLILRVSWLFIFLLHLPYAAIADHCAGGDIVYKHLPNTPDSTYHVIFKFYRDCSGIPAPQSVNLCVSSQCYNSSFGVLLSKSTIIPTGLNGSEVLAGCGNFPSTCVSTSSPLPGFQEWWYEGDVTLPTRCANWELSVVIFARNSSDNIYALGGLYIAATLNNVIAQGNSSPDFTVKPVPYVCLNIPYTYNNGVFDPDGDSLVYSMIMPSTGGCGIQPTPLNFMSGNQVYNLTNNPIACNNSFVLNQFGQMSFVPAQIGKYTMTMLVKEYRNQQLIGSTMRDIQVQMLPCSNLQPQLSFDTTSLVGGQWVNGRIEVCSQTPIQFCFSVSSPDTAAVYKITDNHATSTPTANVSYGGQYTDSVSGCINWQPSNADTGLHVFTITIKDSTCRSPGVATANTYSFPIYVAPVAMIKTDTAICLGQSVTLYASGGSVFSWSVLPGGAPLSSLSCTNCATPVATPLQATQYVVSTNVYSYCNTTSDTVTVLVDTIPPVPVVTVNSPICEGEDLIFSSVSNGSLQWSGPIGFSQMGDTVVINNAQLIRSGMYTAVAHSGVCSSLPAVLQVNVDSIPATPTLIGNSPVCTGGEILLEITSPATVLYNWAGPTGFSSASAKASIASALPQNAGAYTATVYNIQNTNCFSQSVYQLDVIPNAVADFSVSEDTICQKETIIIDFLGSGGIVDSLIWTFADGEIVSGSSAGPYTVRFNEAGTKTLTLRNANESCADSIQKTVTVLSIPPAVFYLQPDACIGERLFIQADRQVNNDLELKWQFDEATVFTGEGRGPYIFYYDQPGKKAVILQTANGECTTTYADTIYVHPFPIADILSLSQDDICTGDSVLITAANDTANNYLWLPETDIVENGNAEVVARLSKSGYIKLSVRDDYGCASIDSIAVHTRPCCEVFLPNAFTPNGDGKNDVYSLKTIGHHQIAGFRIYDRWGQVVFETADEKKGWDGTRSGTPADMGTYSYHLKYKCSDSRYYDKKGTITLIR